MQQAYRVLRIVSAAQAIRIVLMPNPDELTLKELCTACSALNTEGSGGIKAVVLDFKASAATPPTGPEIVETAAAGVLDQAVTAVREVEAPVLAVVRGTLSAPANALLLVADLSLAAHDALFSVADTGRRTGDGPYTGRQALRLGLVNWSVSSRAIDAEMERILDMLREKSAVALRQTKASVRLAGAHTAAHSPRGRTPARLEALKQVNEFYLTHVMQTADAAEGLHAFLEKRRPQWSNR